jgi:hypothetical protein
MIQFFYKVEQLSSKEWDVVYLKIVSIVESFPLKLVRVEAFNMLNPGMDKDHFDLCIDKGTPEERISFYGDATSYTFATNFVIYKHWEKQIEYQFNKSRSFNEIVADKSITWCSSDQFKEIGWPPGSNGTPAGSYKDTSGCLYQYAIMAIAIVLENAFPGRVFVTSSELDQEEVTKIVEWLSVHFDSHFEYPIYFDKNRLLYSFIDQYENKSDAVGRMENLFSRQYKRNIEFAMQNIGYQPTFDYYSRYLTNFGFGTFGFSDVFDPWMAVTKDLESTLSFIAASKATLLEDIANESNVNYAEKYDLSHTLKKLLSEFILWTPQQREDLACFYTNKEALETGIEDLWGSIFRIVGKRVDICPIYANKDSLFEAFMYHDPKNGSVYLKIIEDWIAKNKGSYENFKIELQSAQNEYLEQQVGDESEAEIAEIEIQSKKQHFISQYRVIDRFFIEKAIAVNPILIDIPNGVEMMFELLNKFLTDPTKKDHIDSITQTSKEEKWGWIKQRIKKVEYSVHPDFEEWFDKENDSNVLLFLMILVSLKLYDKSSHFIRFQILYNKKYWDKWRTVSESKILNSKF